MGALTLGDENGCGRTSVVDAVFIVSSLLHAFPLSRERIGRPMFFFANFDCFLGSGEILQKLAVA